ncbi:hypothetical protein Tco_1065334 [Tanacetum coccineum]
MACSLPHTDSEVEALVQKLIDENNGRQNAILDYLYSTAMDYKTNQSNPPTPEKPPMSPISSYPTIEESAEEHEYLTEGGLTEDELHQLAKDEEALKEVLEEQAKVDKENEIKNKELEDFLKEEAAHDELFRMEFGVKSDSEYETD